MIALQDRRESVDVLVYERTPAMPYADGGEAPEPIAPRVVSFAKVDAVRAMYIAQSAVLMYTGTDPTHFIVGWQVWAELSVVEMARPRGWSVTKDGGVMRVLGVPVILDPTRASFIAAVPEADYIVGQAMPPGAVWEGR